MRIIYIHKGTFVAALLSATLTAIWPLNVRAESKLPIGIGYNFEVSSDSICLLTERPMHWSEGVAPTSDSIILYKEAVLVVADFAVIPEDDTDSIWVKVAANQFVMGWLHLSALYENAHPDNPVSAFMHWYPRHHTLMTVLLLSALTLPLALLSLLIVRNRLTLHLPHCNDLPSFYPVMLILATVAIAVMCNYFRVQWHDIWTVYYYYPSLNPLSVTRPLNYLIAAWWLLLLLLFASINDVIHMLRPLSAMAYLLALVGWCLLLFEIIICCGNSVFYLTAYAFYALYAVATYWLFRRSRYVCGHCHYRLHEKGLCPECGSMNV